MFHPENSDENYLVARLDMIILSDSFHDTPHSPSKLIYILIQWHIAPHAFAIMIMPSPWMYTFHRVL